jgi:hypothetical protein
MGLGAERDLGRLDRFDRPDECVEMACDLLGEVGLRGCLVALEWFRARNKFTLLTTGSFILH